MFQYICDSFSLEKIQPLLSYTIIWISLLINWSHLLFRTDFDTKFSKKKVHNYILRRPQNFAKSPPIICPIYWQKHVAFSEYMNFTILSTTLRGRSQTTWTDFWPILTTYLPIVDFRGHLMHYLSLVHVDIEKLDHPPFTTFTEQKKMRL